MEKPSTPGRALAIAAGLVSIAGTVITLFGNAIRHPSLWESYHYTTLLTIAGTIMAGHLFGLAVRRGWRGVLPALGFAVVFASGTALIVYKSAGRQVETASNKAAAGEHRNALIASKLQQRDKALEDLADTKLRIAAEIEGWKTAKGKPTKTPGCGPDCRGFERQRDATQATIDRLEREIAELGPPVKVDAEAASAAELASLLGGDFSKWKAGLVLVIPFMTTLFFEIGSVVSLGFAFGHGRRQPSQTPVFPRATVPATVVATVANDLEPLPPKPGNRRPVATKAAAEADVIRLVARGEPIPSQDHLADRWGVHKGTVSKWLRDFESRGLLSRVTVGRCKAVAAA